MVYIRKLIDQFVLLIFLAVVANVLAGNVALNKPYLINQVPIDTAASFMDAQGSQAFTQTHSWYKGEFTDGATGSTSSSDYAWVYFSTAGRYSVILDLGAVYSITNVKVTTMGNGNYSQVRFPTKIKIYGLVIPGAAMSYEKFCETMETDNQNWTYLGEVVNTYIEDGTSGYVKQTFNLVLAGNPQVRLIKLNIYDDICRTMISEIEVLSDDAAQPSASMPVLVDFPAEGRDVVLPVNIKTTQVLADNRTSLAMGSDAGMRDSPFGWRRPMMEIINNSPSYMRTKGTACLNQVGTRSLRFWDTWDVNYRSWIEWAKVYNHFNPGDPVTVPLSDDNYIFPYYNEIIDYCVQNNYSCDIVLDTWYYDSGLDRVYSTREVANNCPDDPNDPYYTTNPDDPNGILYKAAQRNAVTIASYYHQKGYTNGLVLEIGNEGIGYGTNLSPDGPQYARIVKAFAGAIKQVAPEVKTAFYEWPSDTAIAGLLTGCNDLVDYMVIHPYFIGPDAVKYMIDDRVEALDAAGLNNVNILITEYSSDLWSTISKTYTVGIKQSLMEFAMISHPRVDGLYEFSLFSSAKAMHSDMLYWSIRDNTLNPPSHPVDLHPELRQRFAILPTGMTGNLLNIVTKGKILKYWPGINSNVAGLMSQEGDVKRILLLNYASNPVELRWTGSFFINKTYKLTSTGETWVHTLQQPWSITETTDGIVPDMISAKSMLLIELEDLSDLDHSGLVDGNDLGMLFDYWLDSNCEQKDRCDGRDFNNDGIVDFLDFAELANDWLVSGYSDPVQQLYDDFEDGVLDTSMWNIYGDALTATESGGVLSVLRGSPYSTHVTSLATFAPVAGESVVLSTSSADYTNYAQGGAFGFCDDAGTFSNCVILWQNNSGGLNVYTARGGVVTTGILTASGTQFHGAFGIRWSLDKIVILQNGTTIFDSSDPGKNLGITTWQIPVVPLSIFMRSSLYNQTYGGIYADVELSMSN